MKRITGVFIFIYFCSITLFAQNNGNNNTHIVAPGQTLFFISKMYGISIDEIRKNNPQIGDDLIIKPDDRLNISKSKPKVEIADFTFQTHTVQTKETLYSLSKMYNVSVDELIQMNELVSPSINIGQVLNVKKISLNKEALFTPEKVETKAVVKETKTPEPTKAPVVVQPFSQQPEKVIETKKEPSVLVNQVSTPKVEQTVGKTDSQLLKLLFDSYETNGNTLKKEKGIANFLQQDVKDSYLALVNGVPAGEVIRVRNLMNNKVIYLKVMGNLPDKDIEKNVGLKISKTAATELNIIEDRFLAEWSWFEIKSEKKLNTEGMNFNDF